MKHLKIFENFDFKIGDIVVRNEKGSEEYLKSGVIPESEYLAKKYNI